MTQQRSAGVTPLRVRAWWLVLGVLTSATVVAVLVVVFLVVRAHTTASPNALRSAPPPADGGTSADVGLGGLRPGASAAGALDLLAELPTVDAATAGYDRDSFGEAWADIDGNGCNQRDDVLLRQVLGGTVHVDQQGSCDHDVLAGQWYDPYTGAVLTFDDLKSPEQAQAIQIDHVVPLAEAYRSGADAWSAGQREQFANDLDNLVAVGGAANSTKGDSDPASWLPPEAVECAYVQNWVVIKTRWALSVDSTERVAVTDVLDGC